MRSADECEMSRSCQSTTFSSPIAAAPRTTRASPVIRSATFGLRLCGIAEDPFIPAAKGSSTSRTSVRARWRISVAKRSSDVAQRASARDHLRRHRVGLEPEPGAGGGLHTRVDRAVGADRPRQLPDSAALERPLEPRAVTVELERPAGELPTERRRLRVHAVRAPDADGAAVLLGAASNRLQRTVDAGDDQGAGVAELQRERGIEDVRRREAV